MAMALDYDLLGEVDRLTAGNSIARPRRARDRFGRWHRDDAGEFDWYYGLPETERAYISRRYFSDRGVEVDVLAAMASMDVDAWAESFLGAVRASRGRTVLGADIFSDEWQEAAEASVYDDNVENWLGPWEIADLLEVRRDTVFQWKHRGLLPEPDYELSGNPLWRRSTIEKWATVTNRWPVEAS